MSPKPVTGDRSVVFHAGGSGTATVRIADRFETAVDDLWSALTEPERLGRWLGEVSGDLRVGGEFDARYYASGWEGRCTIAVCEPPHRLVIRTRSEDQPDGVIDVTLVAESEGVTRLLFEDQGVPAGDAAAYGAGDQIHLEDLAAHLSGGDRCDARRRWQELHPDWHALVPGRA